MNSTLLIKPQTGLSIPVGQYSFRHPVTDKRSVFEDRSEAADTQVAMHGPSRDHNNHNHLEGEARVCQHEMSSKLQPLWATMIYYYYECLGLDSLVSVSVTLRVLALYTLLAFAPV